MTRNLFWLGLAAAALVAAWLLAVIVPFFGNVRFDGEDPWAVGSIEDPFAYAGEGVRTIEGTAALRIDPNSTNGILEIELLPDEALAVVLAGQLPERSVVLRLQLRNATTLWADRSIHGDSGIGDSRLPAIHALHAGSGKFVLLIDGKRQPTEQPGYWSLGDSVRQSDGSIRDQGLVFSPLLRDQSGFSDPARKELTLLIYESQDSDAVVLHLVFPDVRTVES
ncbi:hypothetical protein ACFLSZ_03270 [Candidatus Bipolaricaulota bacterium]